MRPYVRSAFALGVVALLAGAAPGADRTLARVEFSIADLQSPWFSATGMRARLGGTELTRLEIAVDTLTVRGRSWRNVTLDCPDFSLERDGVRCRSGTLRGGEPIPVRFAYSSTGPRFELELTPAPGESWRVSGAPAGRGWRAEVDIINSNPTRLAPWLPAGWPKPSAGRLDLTAQLVWERGAPVSATASLRFGGVAFSDEAGLRAGEKLAGEASLDAWFAGGRWEWSSAFAWDAGEVFWQPLYLARGGLQVSASGTLEEDTLRLTQGKATLAGIGTATFSGALRRDPVAMEALQMNASNLDLEGLYDRIARPFLEGTMLGEAIAAGTADLAVDADRAGLKSLRLVLRDAGIRDRRDRFAFGGVSARIPWERQERSSGELRIAAGELLRVPLGPVSLPFALTGYRIALSKVEMPVLDGKLTLDRFRAALEPEGWRWEFAGGLTPVSMESLTRALGIHVMHGTLSGTIPRVRYARSTLEVGGALMIQAFDGTTMIRNLVLQEPLGRAPRLLADIDMSNLDLDLLTGAFSFGSMQGRIDATVQGLELSNWRPVKFDARVASSPGDYRKRISQAAVQNISALGGAGAAAAIQRSFIGVFKEFGYSKIGLSCRLERGVCHMAGVEDAPQGYVIVKGGGVPALTVMGYNRAVSWDELVSRLQRVTQQNLKPVIQ